LLKPTRTGREILAPWGVKPDALPHNASVEHEYWKHKTAENYRVRGYAVAEEVPIDGGRAVDLVAAKGDERVAIEIETDKSKPLANAQKALASGADRVVVISTSSKAAADITAKLGSRSDVEVVDLKRRRQDWRR
jgi:predicted RecB family endonuclease